MKMSRLVLLSGLILGGCAALPTNLPTRPAMLQPEAAATVAELAQEVHAASAPVRDETWWQAFAIPELNQVEEQALLANPDLVTARARLEAASRAEQLVRLDA
ncbi:MAG: hypothetical protein WCA45_04590, partial [Thiobacillaceae bacterium]